MNDNSTSSSSATDNYSSDEGLSKEKVIDVDDNMSDITLTQAIDPSMSPSLKKRKKAQEKESNSTNCK